MSARNYLPACEKSFIKYDCLPNINQHQLGYRSAQELPLLSANTSKLLNRNISYSYDINPFLMNSEDRSGTPFSDLLSENGTSTPDLRSDESDSSSGSILRQSTAEATRILAEEWQRIERTLYEEEGEKSTRPHIVEECKQWRQLHPQLRVVGKAISCTERRPQRHNEHDEVIAMQYTDYQEFSESEERLSESSTDVTPQNSPRPSTQDMFEPKRDRVTFQTYEEEMLPDTFCSLLQITPLQIRSPSLRRKQGSLLRSEIASSKWMRSSRPDSSINCDRNSAKSFVSLDTRNCNAMSASDRNKKVGRVVTARYRDMARLEPIWTPESSPNELSRPHGHHVNMRKVSLPPLLLEEEKRKVASAKKLNIKGRKSVKNYYHLDRVRH